MSEAKMLCKVELVGNKPVVSLGTGHVALLSLAVQLLDLAVKEQIIMQEEKVVESQKSPIIQPNSEVKSVLVDSL